MRNFKKVVALVLALAMVLSMNTVTFAAEMTAAEKAETLMLLKGDGNGVTAEYLAKVPTRLQAAIISLRLQGLETEALAFEGTESFTDATDVAWAGGKAVLAYLKANPSAGWIGYEDGSFMPNEPISAQAYVKVMLEALGYTQGTDFEWADVFTFAATKGLTALTADSAMTNDSLAVGMIDALAATNADGVVLLDALIAAGAITEEAAIAAGLKVAVVELAVKSVTATNLKQIVVTYNKAIDAAGDEDNYSLNDDATAAIDDTADFALSADGTVVTITLGAGEVLDQQEVIDLTIEDILAADTTVEDIVVMDVTIPTVVSAEAVGNDTLKVFFSEPMETTTLETNANYSVKDADGDTLYVKDVTAGTNEMSALVELFADLDGDVTITVDDVEDYQGFACLETALAVTVVIDTTAPVVVSYEDASTTGVTLVFDNDVELAGDNTDFYHTNANNTADVGGVAVDGNKITLDFTDNELPVGTAYVYVAADAVNDLWDNENDKITVVVTVTVDEIAPTVVGEVDVTEQDTIEVTYSEDIAKGDDFVVTLLDEDGDDTEINSTATVSDEVLTIVFDEDIYGDYTVVIEDVEDTAGNTAADASLAFFVADETAPVYGDFTATLYNAGTDDQLVVIDFDEEMSAASVTTKGLYFYGATSLDDSDVTITVTNSGKSVEIEAPAADVVTMIAGNDLTIGRVADAAGNLLTTLSGPLTLVDGDATEVAIDTVEMTAVNTIVLTVDGDELTTLDISKFSFEDDSDNVLDIAKVKTGLNSDGETTITFTLGTDLMPDGTTDGTDYVNIIVAAGAGSNQYGQDLETVLDGADLEVADAVAPTVESVVFNSATQIIVTFDEDLEADFFAGAGSNGFAVSEGTLNTAQQVVADGNQVVLSGTSFTKTGNVSYTAGTIEDQNDNKLASFSHTDTLAVFTATAAATPNATATLAITVIDEAYTAAAPTADLLTAGAGGVTVGDFKYVASGTALTDAADDDLVVTITTAGALTFAFTDGSTDTGAVVATVTVTHVPSGAVEVINVAIDAADAVVVTAP